MSVCTDTRTAILAKIATIDTQIAAANTALEASLETELESYTFDSAEARQQAKLRDSGKILKSIDSLERRRDYLCRRINNANIVTMNSRRK